MNLNIYTLWVHLFWKIRLVLKTISKSLDLYHSCIYSPTFFKVKMRPTFAVFVSAVEHCSWLSRVADSWFEIASSLRVTEVKAAAQLLAFQLAIDWARCSARCSRYAILLIFLLKLSIPRKIRRMIWNSDYFKDFFS